MKQKPTATYRIQFRNGFGFDQAIATIPYLARLGVSHLYASPLFTAVSSSTHGYDVADCNAIDPALGGMAGFERMCEELDRHAMGLLLDIVPNHMAASLENPWWRSVVRLGASSPFAGHFDIDWNRRLTLPFLGRPFADALGQGELTLGVGPDCWPGIRYFETIWPIAPQTWGLALAEAKGALAGELRRIALLPAPAVEAAMARLAERLDPRALDSALADASADRPLVARVHERQPWELTFWKEARRNLSYRRFFEVTGLAGLRVEDRRVFDDVHRLTLRLVREGRVDGLRIDHVDGLADPGAYLARLRAEAGPEAWIVVEKILEHGEVLRPDWPVQGTTGYEFIDAMADVLCDGDGLRRLRSLYVDDTAGLPVAALAQEAKAQVVNVNFEGELERLAALAARPGDYPTASLARALSALVVAMPVYRTYLPAEGGRIAAADMDTLETARAHAIAAVPADAAELEFLFSVLAGLHPASATAEGRALRTRFQQLTGPAMAKGVEDTLFYRDATLLALDEVGTSPQRPWPMPDRFHDAMSAKLRRGGMGLNATATHDTKRGEDARARLFALTGAPEEWQAVVEGMSGRCSGAIRQLGSGRAPERQVEHLLWQSMLGAAGGQGDLRRRMTAFATKAVREAKLRTDWLDHDEEYETAIAEYVNVMTEQQNVAEFLRRCQGFMAAGWRNGLVQTFLKLAAPGIPDIYQGVERGDFSLVDPDNRSPVDFCSLAAALPKVEPDIADHGGWKHWLIGTVLRERRIRPGLFSGGTYQPLRAEGGGQAVFLAFARTLGDEAAIAIARLPSRAAGGDSARLALPGELCGRSWRNVLPDERTSRPEDFPLGELLGRRGMALLVTA